MNDQFISDLRLLLDNGLHEQFELFEYPRVVSAEFILAGVAKVIARLLRTHDNLATTERLLACTGRIIAAIPPTTRISRYRIAIYLELFEGLLLCGESRRFADATRARVFGSFGALLDAFDACGRYLLVRRLFTRVANGEFAVTHEAQVLAFLVDRYRVHMTRPALANSLIFRAELTFFYGAIARIRYTEVEHGDQFMRATALLMQAHAALGFDVRLLRAAKRDVLEPLSVQIADFCTLARLKSEASDAGEDAPPPSAYDASKTVDDVRFDFLRFSLTYATREVDKRLAAK